jgi:protein-L-isoaspartate(D-aspartate) O-methyltransferase
MRVHRLDPVQNARTNMVLSQLKPNGVVDHAILNVLNNVPRENFIPINSFSIAYADAPIFYDIPGRYIFAPQTLGLFLQNLNLAANDKVLVVGGNYGYTATVLFELGCHVFVAESQPIFLSKCREKLKKHNMVIESRQLNLGLQEHGPYQAIVIEVGLKEIPDAVVNQLANNGRIALCLANDASKLSKGFVFQKNSENLDLVVTFEASMPLCPDIEEFEKFQF